jgi:heme-degrading monooxygenase HmoA
LVHIVWEFVVKDGAVEEFVRGYAADGDWARLFAGHAGFRGTTLLRDARAARRFLTVDRWDSLDDFQRMKATSGSEYADLDGRFAGLTESEREIGVFADQPAS